MHSVPDFHTTGLGACENAEEALLEFDQAIRGEHGGAHNPHGLGGKSGKTADDIVNVYDIHVDNNSGTVRPSGISAQAGLRRIEKAAEAGDGNAAEMLRRVLDPSDGMTVHGACVELGWRKPSHADAPHDPETGEIKNNNVMLDYSQNPAFEGNGAFAGTG
jgi:hypothetical protein